MERPNQNKMAGVMAMLSVVVVITLAAGCTPAQGVGGPAVDAAHERVKLSNSEPETPQADPWPDMPEEIRGAIVSDALAGVDPRLVDVEQRLTAVERLVDSQAESVTALTTGLDALAGRVDVLENLPKAPTPTVTAEEWDAVRGELERQEKQLAALMAEDSDCKCGADCTCGPDCDCPESCDADCPCQRAATATAAQQPMGSDPVTRSVSTEPQKAYASVTMLSLPGCPPCEQWKRDVLPELLDKGWQFSEATLTSGRAPQFRVCIGDACYVHQGFMTGNDLARIVRQHNGQPEPVRVRSATAPQPTAVLHREWVPFRDPAPLFGNPMPVFGSRVRGGLFGGAGMQVFARGGCCGG